MSETETAFPKATHVRWADLEIEPMNPQLTRRFLTGAEAMLARIDLKKGALVPWHSHPNEQIAWIAEGALRFTLGSVEAPQVVEVRAGEVLVIPSNLPHQAEALEDTTDYDIFAPPRGDWLRREDAYLR